MIVSFDDIDLPHYADNYFSLKFCLEQLLNRELDLLEDAAINNPYFRRAVDAQKMIVYEC